MRWRGSASILSPCACGLLRDPSMETSQSSSACARPLSALSLWSALGIQGSANLGTTPSCQIHKLIELPTEHSFFTALHPGGSWPGLPSQGASPSHPRQTHGRDQPAGPLASTWSQLWEPLLGVQRVSYTHLNPPFMGPHPFHGSISCCLEIENSDPLAVQVIRS